MAANELAEALQALAWVKLQGVAPFLTADGIGFRSLCGFKQSILASEDVKNFPLIVLELERTQNRRETCVIATPIVTVNDLQQTLGGPNPGYLFNYTSTSPAPSYPPPPAVQPIHLDWIGDPAAPAWLPFQTDTPLPGGFDPDLFNAIAIQMPFDEIVSAGDVSIAVYRMPPLQGVVPVSFTIAAPPPPPPPGP